MQLKPKHQPYKLGRQWQELLLRFTDAPDDDVAMGQCCSACASLARGPTWVWGVTSRPSQAAPGRWSRAH